MGSGRETLLAFGMLRYGSARESSTCQWGRRRSSTVLASSGNPRRCRTTPHAVNSVFGCVDNQTDDKMGDQTVVHPDHDTAACVRRRPLYGFSGPTLPQEPVGRSTNLANTYTDPPPPRCSEKPEVGSAFLRLTIASPKVFFGYIPFFLSQLTLRFRREKSLKHQ